MTSKMTKFESLLEAVPDALVGMDQKGVVRFVNRQTESLFGYDRDDLIGQPIETLVPESLWQIYAEHQEDYFADPRTRSSGLELELTGRLRDGTDFPVNISVSQIDTGDVLLVITAVAAVTKQKVAVKNAQLTAAIVDSSDDAIIGSTLGGVITSWNPAAERMYGYSSKEVIGKSASILTSDGRAGEIHAVLARVKGGEAVKHLEIDHVRKDGTVVPVSVTVAPIRDAAGLVVGSSAVARDVTEQRHALSVAQRLAAIVEDSDDAILSTTVDGSIMSWNPAAERLYGYTAQEIIGKSLGLLSPEDRTDEITAASAKIKAGQHVQHLETTRVRKDGTVVLVSLTVSPIRDAAGVVVGTSVIHRDLTEQEHTARYARSLIEAALDALVTISPEGKITDVNEAAIKITGVPRERLIGSAASDYFTEPDKADEGYQRVFEEGSVTDYPLTLRHQDGMLTEVLCNASVYRDTSGKVLGVFAAARDVTQQKQALATAQTDRAALRATVDSLLDPYVVLEAVRDEAGQIVDFVYVDANPAACAYNGLAYQDLVGARLLELLPGHASAGLLDQYGQVVETGEPLVQDDVVYAQELLGGVERHYDARAARVGDGLSYTWRDVTDRHVAAQRLAASQEQYRVLAENASDVIMRLSPDREFEWVSGSLVDVLGWEAPDLVGHLIDEFIHPDDLAWFREVVADAAQGSTARVEFRFRRSRGTYRWVACRMRVEVDQDGTTVAVVGGLVDIEDRKAVEAQELDRLDELERFQRLTVERELKMIELKKEIEHLRKFGPADGSEPGDADISSVV